MSLTKTARFALNQWNSGSDPLTRVQTNADNLAVESRGATFTVGSIASASASDAAYARGFFLDTAGVLYVNTQGASAASWVALNAFGDSGDIATLSGTASAASGSSVKYARADHVHAVSSGAAPASVSTTAAAGSASTLARSDHGHTIGSGAINNANMFAVGVVPGTALNSAIVSGSGGLTFSSGVLSAKVDNSSIKIDGSGQLYVSSTFTGTIPVDNTTIEQGGSGLNIKAAGVGTAQVADSAITGRKIATGALKSDGGLQRSGTGDSTVLGILLDGSTLSLSASGLKVNTVSATELAASAVTTAKIAANAVTAAKLNADVVGTNQGLKIDSGTGAIVPDVDGTTITVTAGKIKAAPSKLAAVALLYSL